MSKRNEFIVPNSINLHLVVFPCVPCACCFAVWQKGLYTTSVYFEILTTT